MQETRAWQRWLVVVLRSAVLLIGCAVLIGSASTWLPGWLLLLMLLASFGAPLLWPNQFGSWWGLLGVITAAALPAIVVHFRPLPANPDDFLSLISLVWLPVTWSLLPVTILLVCWRRRASPYVTLLGITAMPIALVVMSTNGLLTSDPNVLPLAESFAILANMLPLWFGTLACMIGPVFFAGSMTWLAYRELARPQ